ncbi:MAG: hypothetical protein V8R63_07245 [Thomasclavelia ramosa]
MAFGPTNDAATLEGSKAFSKDFMIIHNIQLLNIKKLIVMMKPLKQLANLIIR